MIGKWSVGVLRKPFSRYVKVPIFVNIYIFDDKDYLNRGHLRHTELHSQHRRSCSIQRDKPHPHIELPDSASSSMAKKSKLKTITIPNQFFFSLACQYGNEGLWSPIANNVVTCKLNMYIHSIKILYAYHLTRLRPFYSPENLQFLANSVGMTFAKWSQKRGCKHSVKHSNFAVFVEQIGVVRHALAWELLP